MTEPLSLQIKDEILPQPNGNNLHPIVSQSQTGINNSHADLDDEEIPITISSGDPEFYNIVKN